MPKGYDETFHIKLPIGKWGGVAFPASWVVALLEPSSWDVIDWDYCHWTYQPKVGPPTTPEDFAKHFEQAVRDCEHGMPLEEVEGETPPIEVLQPLFDEIPRQALPVGGVVMPVNWVGVFAWMGLITAIALAIIIGVRARELTIREIA